MGRDTLTFKERWKKNQHKIRVKRKRHREFAAKDMVKQIEWRAKMNLSADNRAIVGLCKILLDNRYLS